jgi:presenilin-like A22 family membrane protease
MITLADAVGGLRLPVLLVIPKHRSYSFRTAPRIKQQLEGDEEREAMFMGLGDIIVPGILVVSAFANLRPPMLPEGDGLRALLVALATLTGALVGFLALMRYVLKGNPQAGLPLLNGGAITGYVLSYVFLFQDLSLGITF